MLQRCLRNHPQIFSQVAMDYGFALHAIGLILDGDMQFFSQQSTTSTGHNRAFFVQTVLHLFWYIELISIVPSIVKDFYYTADEVPAQLLPHYFNGTELVHHKLDWLRKTLKQLYGYRREFKEALLQYKDQHSQCTAIDTLIRHMDYPSY
jgi:hypothetical protein